MILNKTVKMLKGQGQWSKLRRYSGIPVQVSCSWQCRRRFDISFAVAITLLMIYIFFIKSLSLSFFIIIISCSNLMLVTCNHIGALCFSGS